MLTLAIFFLIAIGVIHSYLGEKYILIRLFRRDNLPHLFGSDDFTKRTLRFAWHITTIAWWGFAVILFTLLEPIANLSNTVLSITGTVFLFSGLIALVGSKGKHLSWIAFFTIAICCYATSFSI